MCVGDVVGNVCVCPFNSIRDRVVVPDVHSVFGVFQEFDRQNKVTRVHAYARFRELLLKFALRRHLLGDAEATS